MLADALYKWIVEHVLLKTFESVIVDVLFIRTASSSQQRGEKKKPKNQTLLFVEINENWLTENRMVKNLQVAAFILK